MELAFLAFIVALIIASVFGWTSDSRDSADWAPSVNGNRAAR
jgi:hypothetical protein